MSTPSIMLAFGFGSWAMLGWLAVAAAPIVIHLLNKRRYREVEWAAVEFLLAAVRRSARRMRLQQWLLLAIRTLLVALLVLALAEPYLERVGLPLASGQRTHKLLVIDGSYSMAYRPTDVSRFDRAKQLAQQIVDESPQGDGFTLLLLADPPREVVSAPSFAAADFNDEIESLALPHGGGDVPATLAKVEDLVQRVAEAYPRFARHEVYFLTDMQRTDWLAEHGGAEAMVEARRRAERLARQCELVVVDLGQGDAENLAVTRLAVVEPLATVGRPLSIEAQVHNFGRQRYAQQVVELFVDGRAVDQQRVDLEPGATLDLGFSYRFETGGEHQIELRLPGDLLDVDNRRWLSLPVKERIRVLCVDGRPAGGPLGGATAYLSVALAPEAGRDGALVEPEVVSESALVELDLARYDAVFLANVGQFTSAEARLLDAYLQDGGGVVFFLGDRAQAESYNWHLAGDDPQGVRVLPARLTSPAPESTYRLDPLDYRDPIVQVFRGQEQGGLLTTTLSEYFRVALPEGSAARTALAVDNGDPLILVEPVHRGRSILVTTSADTSWTTMPLWPSYVPIVQELLAAAVGGRHDERNVEVGEPLPATVREGTGDAPTTVRLPTGDELNLSSSHLSAQGRPSFADTLTSGLYEVQYTAPVARSQWYAVNPDARQGDLARIDVEQFRSEVWPGVPFLYRTTWHDVEAPQVAALPRRGRLHRSLLYGVLVLLFAESLLAWQWGNRGR